MHPSQCPFIHFFPIGVSTEAIDPKNLCVAFISPRQRSHKTFHLLFGHLPKVPDHVITEECREWDYGLLLLILLRYTAVILMCLDIVIMRAFSLPRSRKGVRHGRSGKTGKLLLVLKNVEPFQLSRFQLSRW